MKFLTFNIVVAAAIGYLLMAEKPEVRNSEVASSLIASAETAWNKATGAVQDATQALEKKPAVLPVVADETVAPKVAKTPMVRRAPAPKGQEVEVADAVDVPPVSAVEIDQQKAAAVAAKDPAAARRRAEVLGGTEIAQAQPTQQVIASNETQKQKFMSPRDRRRELLRLAEDMELQFLDTVNQ